MKFLQAWFSDSNSASSKRIAGTIGFLVSIILIIAGSENHLIEVLIYCSVALLGLGSADRFIQARAGLKNYNANETITESEN